MSNKNVSGTKGSTVKKQNTPQSGGIKKPVVNAMCKDLELISYETAEQVCKQDAPLMSTRTEAFVTKNSLNYYIVCNTWLLQVKKVSECYLDLLDEIRYHGLIPTIEKCNSCALSAINYGSAKIKENHSWTKWSDYVSDSSTPTFLVGIISDCDGLSQVLQLLRYAKRFCPVEADITLDRGLKSFRGVNEHCKQTNELLCAENYLRKAARSLRPYVAKILKGYVFDPAIGSFSNGVATDAKQPLYGKLTAYAKYYPNFGDPLYPRGSAQRLLKDDDMVCFVQAVPKSFKTPRIIAMESSNRQYHMQAMRMKMEGCIASNIHYVLDTHDQSINQVLCRDGAIRSTYATIDLSSASDSLSRYFVMECFPDDAWEDMITYLSKYMSFDKGKTKSKVHMFSTSGSALTFVVESIVFVAICLQVADDARVFTGINYLRPRVFGDDMVVDNRLFESITGRLEDLRFFVNREKSFGGDSCYRESCGVEYALGLPTHTRYFPRKPLSWTERDVNESIASLCQLQHRLFSECRQASDLVAHLVRSLEPRMTSSVPGSECMDLWSNSPVFKLRVPSIWRPRYNPKWDNIQARLSKRFNVPAKKCVEGIQRGKTTVPEWALQHAHLSLVDTYPDIQDQSKYNLELLEMWRYRNFLQYGPKYEDNLLELLKVTQAPLPLSHSIFRPTSKWSYVK